ncbi:hypothetical protein I7I50_09307 [Histoplasma capsulatum G186AR]|uniref:Uncharacterized protein n=1 Tax=Ajellomyces capsulatus TaxID=5037 RepID=A0A8H8D075_AJECA|nr:hypothetical protein I7I52_06828 [Histoplasma capsulatum]QSS74221.1 hypothetical protein I7I50_09307 [Histoplasma capsulatum G186AR]
MGKATMAKSCGFSLENEQALHRNALAYIRAHSPPDLSLFRVFWHLLPYKSILRELGTLHLSRFGFLESVTLDHIVPYSHSRFLFAFRFFLHK